MTPAAELRSLRSPATMRRAVRAGTRAALELALPGEWVRWRLPRGEPGIALTFDDGPHPEVTPRVLDALAAAGASATFFLCGERVALHPELVRRIWEEGHSLGSHTWSHARCSRLSLADFAAEVRSGERAVRDAVPEAERLPFRPPFGELTAGQAARLVREGTPVVLWSRDPEDYRGASAEALERAAAAFHARDIVLLHDRFPATAAALPGILAILAARGLRTTRVPLPRD